MPKRVLLTGFEPYGGRGFNPSAAVTEGLHGEVIDGVEVSGRVLPVALAGLAERVDRLLAETGPVAVINLGLAPGTPVVRLERVGVNVAEFDVADNAGYVCRDEPLQRRGPDALFATLPLRAIEASLLNAGIPARVSDTAGTYLCNATLYRFLYALRESATPCGFIHLPYAPRQVAELIDATRQGRRLEIEQRADLASMDLATMTEAVRIALAETLNKV